MTVLREWLLILGVFAIAAALWHPIIYPKPVIQEIRNDMRGARIDIYEECNQKPIKMQIPEMK